MSKGEREKLNKCFRKPSVGALAKAWLKNQRQRKLLILNPVIWVTDCATFRQWERMAPQLSLTFLLLKWEDPKLPGGAMLSSRPQPSRYVVNKPALCGQERCRKREHLCGLPLPRSPQTRAAGFRRAIR